MVRLHYHPALIVYIVFLSVVFGETTAPTVEYCPIFRPRRNPPKDVLDLRLDDIEYIAAMGDSSMAGYGMEDYEPGFFSFLNPKISTEYRGMNYVSGANPGAPTFANFLKHYNPYIKGGSVGSHGTHVCFGPCPIYYYNPSIDNLNAARSGARSSGLMSQIDYLEAAFKSYRGSQDKWKMIVLQIGANDACNNCQPKYKDTSSLRYWTTQLEQAILRIKKTFPKTIVYILGSFKMSKTLYFGGEFRQCSDGFFKNYKMCPCGTTDDKILFADKSIEKYNHVLKYITHKLAAKAGDDFGIIYSGASNDNISLPYEALTNVDCFHPSVAGHEWLAKVIWNNLFRRKTPDKVLYDPLLEVVCPSPSHRLPVSAA